MLEVFKEVEKKRMELEKLRIIVQANEITYRQKGEFHTAERFEKLENKLAKTIRVLSVEIK